MFTLIKNANLYAPAYLGKTDILLCGEKIAHISKTIELNHFAILLTCKVKLLLRDL